LLFVLAKKVFGIPSTHCRACFMGVAIAIEVVVPFYCGVYICWQEIAFVCSHSIDTIATRNNLHFFMLPNFKLCSGPLFCINIFYLSCMCAPVPPFPVQPSCSLGLSGVLCVILFISACLCQLLQKKPIKISRMRIQICAGTRSWYLVSGISVIRPWEGQV